MPPITIKAISQILFSRSNHVELDTANTLFKRDNASDRFSLYVFAIIVGCIAIVLIGCGIYSMYNGNSEERLQDVPYEQRKYMHEVRQRNLNGLAWTARRPDMIVPVERLNV